MTDASPSSLLPKTSYRWQWISMLSIMFVFAFFLNLSLGSVHIPFAETWHVLTGGESTQIAWEKILLYVRLPKAITAILAGAALAVAGLQMQTLFRNPLADPFVLGINAGASLGVSIVVLILGSAGISFLAGLGIAGHLSIVAASTLGSALVFFIVMLAARRVDGMTLLILGLMFGYIASACVSVLLYFSVAEKIQAYLVWTYGNFGYVTWEQMKVFAPAIILGISLALLLSKTLNALLIGETYASSMGLHLKRARLGIILSASILAGTVTGFCGPIGFLGIAVPHLCRGLLRTSNHRVLLPASILLGSNIALIANLIAQVPGKSVTFPLSSVTALVGAPVIIWLLIRRRHKHNTFPV